MLVRIVYEFSPPRKSGQSVAAPPRFAIQDNLISPTGESSLVADKNPNQSNIRPTPSNPETVALLRVHTRLSRKETENEQKARRVPVRAQARAARAANDESHKDLTRTYKSLMAKLKRERKSIRAAELEGYALSNERVNNEFQLQRTLLGRDGILALSIAAADRAQERSR